MQDTPAISYPDKKRWIVLTGYMLVSMSSQLVWLNFAGIISPQMEELFHVGLEPLGLMSGLWPLLFIPISIPTGLLVDRWGFKRIVSIGGIILVIFSWLRIFSGQNFEILFIFQVLGGIGQPFIYNGISKLSGNWFPEGEQTMANGIAIMGQIIGMILALVLVPLLVPAAIFSDFEKNIAIVSLIVTVSVIFFIFFAKEHPNGESVYVKPQEKVTQQIKILLRMKNIVLLIFLFLIGVGIFSGLVQWIESILFSKGIKSIDGGFLGAAMLISGIFGMIIISYISDKYSKLKQIIIINSLLIAFLFFFFSFAVDLISLAITAIAIGFLLLSLAPVGFQISLETAGKERAGTAASLIWLMSQIGALFFILFMPFSYSLQMEMNILVNVPWFLSIVILGIFMIIASLLGFMIQDTRMSKKREGTSNLS